MKVEIESLEDLKNFTKRFSECLKGNEVILLKGDLAAGKTTFTRFLVSSIDEDAEDQVTSPTFSIMNEYETSRYPVYHIDLYRVKDFDFSDVLGHGIVVIEWAEERIIDEIENLPVVFVNIEVKNSKRTLSIKLKNADHLKKCI